MGKDRKGGGIQEGKAEKKKMLLRVKKTKKLKKSGKADDETRITELQIGSHASEKSQVILQAKESKKKATKKKSALAKVNGDTKRKRKKLKDGQSYIGSRDVEEETQLESKDEEEETQLESKDEEISEANGDIEDKLGENPSHQEALSEVVHIGVPEKAKKKKKKKTEKLKKADRNEEKDLNRSSRENKLEHDLEVDAATADEISSVDEDCSRGMKKWLLEYKQSRPGIKVLQEKIDEFITAHEEQLEQERKEREARSAEEGWTVVTQQKGRKKTTDPESGISVGSVSMDAIMNKMAQKKEKEVPLDFYRFQKKEAQRSEIMMLQSRFEQDKKRMQELRAARKFRPY